VVQLKILLCWMGGAISVVEGEGVVKLTICWMRRRRMFNILESSWLKAKLADNADVFSSRLTGSSPSQLQAPASPIRSLCYLLWQSVTEGHARSSPRMGPPRMHACTPQNTGIPRS